VSVLSDRDIRDRISFDGYPPNYRQTFSERQLLRIDPFDDSQIQPASVDLTLSNEFMTYEKRPEVSNLGLTSTYAIDIDRAKEVRPIRYLASEWRLDPHELVLCSTREYVDIPDDIQAQVHGKSSLGRLGLLVHVTAGFIDPGFKGKITLEMYNLNNRPIILRKGKPICQISFMSLTSAAEFPYGHEKLNSKYQDQKNVTGSKYAG
jgi:dCTP deaminase